MEILSSLLNPPGPVWDQNAQHTLFLKMTQRKLSLELPPAEKGGFFKDPQTMLLLPIG
jgi:hypothetical protein